MIKIDELRPMDIITYKNFFSYINEIYGSFCGTYYKLTIDEEKFVIHRMNNRFTMLNLKTNKLEFFTTDDEYNIEGIIINDKHFQYYGKDLICKDIKTGISENLSLVKRENGEDIDGYNGLAVYGQYDSKRDLRIIYTFQHMYNQAERIYDMHLQKPFTIAIDEQAGLADKGLVKPKTEKYIKDDYDLRDEPITFNLATIKDYGIKAFLEHGSYSLQKSSHITRYYKVLATRKDQTAFVLFPLCKQYRIEDINERVKELGFNTEVPEILLSVYNRDNEALKRFVEIAKTLKAIELENENKSFGYKISE